MMKVALQSSDEKELTLAYWGRGRSKHESYLIARMKVNCKKMKNLNVKGKQ